ncbi:glycerophosphodiester phosphodiesterase family protein [Hoeflea poritis]|uniref:Glycerophosphodiester phosphodiesterase family protein n=1 Tax=Hoeflea poritis TaxID=2993659 RepID=A0ABT4VQI6_9HYPH|nr:glycerophosphodiester phosphodiesterase family protein [Hoeflea poritis]MDA4846961.1 glycerophosphodiester phosphodiesterase family protein [Hoeflea poritis]
MPHASPIVDAPLLAHRGASLYAPENTLQAVQRAAEMGAKWIETDVQLTADDELVIIHDLELDRTTNGSGFVAHHTLDEIRDLDAGSWFGHGFGHCKVPTLEEFIGCVVDNGLNLQLELKELAGREYHLSDRACDALAELWPFGERKLFVSGFSARCMRRIAEKMPDVPRAIALICVPDDPDAYAEEHGVQIIHVQDKFVDDEALEIVRASATEFGVATVNDPLRAKYLLRSGVESVLTDDPLLLERGHLQAVDQIA